MSVNPKATLTNRAPGAPTPNVETQAFWDGAAEGRLRLKRCRACGEVHYYPRALCPFCYGETDWIDASGEATVYSYSIMRKADVPYVIAYVTLKEGPTIMTALVDWPFDEVRVGAPALATFALADDGATKVPVFKPA